MKKLIIRLVLLLVLAGAAYGGYRFLQQMPARQQQIATTKVRQGDVVVRSYARGELRATRSVTLTAPNLFGTVQVTRLAPLGSFARGKDLIVEFDDSEVISRIEEKQLEIDQIDEQIKKAKADLAIRNNQDQVELLKTRYSVRRAELEVKRNELLSTIDQQKNKLNLDEAQRRLKQLESDIKSRQEQAQAELAVLQERRKKGELEMGREKQRLTQVKLLAPMSGLVAVKQNRGNGFFFGQQLPDIREGDQIQPGMPVADILDVSNLEVSAKVGELDRANLREGQDVNIKLDAIADRRFAGKIKNLSGTASPDFFSADPAKKFDVTFTVDMKQLLAALGGKPEQIQKLLATAEQNQRQGTPGVAPAMPAAPPPPMMRTASMKGPAGGSPKMPMSAGAPFSAAEMDRAKLPPAPEEDSQMDVLLRPGLLVDVEIIVDKVPNAVHIPLQALFEKEGKPVVYVKTGEKFVERAIKPAKRSESTLVVAEGLRPGELVALANPFDSGKKKKGDKSGGGNAMGSLPGGGK